MADKAAEYGSWLYSARQRTSLTQQDVADRMQGVGQDRSQGWVSRVETGKTGPTPTEAVLLAALVRADPVQALKVAGFLDEPPLMRIDTKLDTVIRLLREGGK